MTFSPNNQTLQYIYFGLLLFPSLLVSASNALEATKLKEDVTLGRVVTPILFTFEKRLALIGVVFTLLAFGGYQLSRIYQLAFALGALLGILIIVFLTNREVGDKYKRTFFVVLFSFLYFGWVAGAFTALVPSSFSSFIVTNIFFYPIALLALVSLIIIVQRGNRAFLLSISSAFIGVLVGYIAYVVALLCEVADELELPLIIAGATYMSVLCDRYYVRPVD